MPFRFSFKQKDGKITQENKHTEECLLGFASNKKHRPVKKIKQENMKMPKVY